MPGSRFARPPLSSLLQPFSELGGTAMRRLISAIIGTPIQVDTQLIPTLVARQSTLGF